MDLATLRRRAVDVFEVEAPLPPSFLARALADTDATARTAGHVRARLQIQPDGTVLLLGRLEASFTVPCGRCLHDADVDASTDLLTTSVPRDQVRVRAAATRAGDDEDEEGLWLEAADLDEAVHDPDELDLRPLLAEQIALAYPMRALCALGEDCRGLCTVCGRDFNELAYARERCSRCGFDGAAARGPTRDPDGVIHRPEALVSIVAAPPRRGAAERAAGPAPGPAEGPAPDVDAAFGFSPEVPAWKRALQGLQAELPTAADAASEAPAERDEPSLPAGATESSSARPPKMKPEP